MVEVAEHLKGRDFTRIGSWSSEELKTVLDLADELKELQRRREPHELLPGRTVGLIFQKPSTRTRVSFEVGIAQLGGHGLYLAAGDLQLGRGETIRDTATVLSRYLDAIMIRTFAQEDVEELAEHADIPVINGLTDYAHPCQALADLMTIRERLGRLSGVRLAYLGDGNNVCVSLMVGGREARNAIRRRDAARATSPTPTRSPPPGAPPSDGRHRRARPRPTEAAADADVALHRRLDEHGPGGGARAAAARPRRLPDRRRRSSALAAADAIVLHCLPAHYGEEITEEVLYGPQSAVWDQAENRLHAQKALMALIVRSACSRSRTTSRPGRSRS